MPQGGFLFGPPLFLATLMHQHDMPIKDFVRIEDYLLTSKLGVEQKMNDFVLYAFEELSEEAELSHRAYRQHYVEISLEVSAGCSFQIDHVDYPPAAKRLTVIAPHRLQTNVVQTHLPEKSSGFTMFFAADFLGAPTDHQQWYAAFGLSDPLRAPAIYLDDRRLGEIKHLFELIKYEQDHYGEQSREIIRHIVKIILEKTSMVSNPCSVPCHPIVAKFVHLCRQPLLGMHTVQQYACHLGVSPKYLTELVKTQTGQTALETIHQAKLSLAMGLLCQTSSSVKQVAYALGFEHPEYFNAFFRKMTGQTPGQFRKNST